MKKKIHNQEILKAVYATIPVNWDSRISLDSRQYWDSAKQLILADNFVAQRNEIFQELVNRIGLTKVLDNSFTNPLSMLKRGNLDYGDVIQEIVTDVLKEEKFNPNEADQFEKAKAKVSAAYHKINRESMYTVTIDDPRLKRAFVDDYGLQALISSMIKSLTDSNTVDEFIYAKKLISDYIRNTEYPLQTTQYVTVPNIINENRTSKDLTMFLEKIKTALRSMNFPNRKYTPYGLMTQTNPSDLVCFLKADVTVINEVNNLSSAFNPEYLDVKVPIVALDEIDANDHSIVGIICDVNLFEIRDTLRTLTTADNARSLYRNHFYHVHQIYTSSPFMNAIVIKMDGIVTPPVILPPITTFDCELLPGKIPLEACNDETFAASEEVISDKVENKSKKDVDNKNDKG